MLDKLLEFLVDSNFLLQVLVISNRAGGLGLNLASANHMVIFDQTEILPKIYRLRTGHLALDRSGMLWYSTFSLPVFSGSLNILVWSGVQAGVVIYCCFREIGKMIF